jgi:phosphoribosylformylglycinamidine synthase
MDLSIARKLHDFMLEIIGNGWVRSAHDCSEGGLAVALAECCMSNGDAMTGATIDLSRFTGRLDALLFGETQSRIVMSCSRDNAERITRSSLPVTQIGFVGGDALRIKTKKSELSWPVQKLRDAWWNAIDGLMKD